MYETDYEDLLLANAGAIYPGFAMCWFKPLVESDLGSARPDLALVDRAYRAWWVVEVELGSHPLRSHVERQVAVFSRGSYGPDHAEFLVRGGLDRERVYQMMRGLPPRVLVLVDRIEPEWNQVLARYDAMLDTIEVYRSQRNDVVLRVGAGEDGLLDDPETFVTICRRDRHLPTLLRVDSPASLPGSQGGSLRIMVDGAITDWSRTDTDSGCWLVPAGRYALIDEHSVFQIHASREGTLVLTVRR
jgi:hypothetical protein